MTTNQIEYRKMIEQHRSNRAQEEISKRFNAGTLANQQRSNEIAAYNAETSRKDLANKAKQAEASQMSAQGTLMRGQANLQSVETDRQRLEETKRSNLTNEYYKGVSARQQTQSLDQNSRQLAINAYNADTARQNVGVGYANVGLGYSQLNELHRHQVEEEKIIPSKITTHYGGVGENVSHIISNLATGAAVGAAARGAGSRAAGSVARTAPALGRTVINAVKSHPYVAIGTGILAGGAYVYNRRKNVAEQIVNNRLTPEEVD